MSDGTGIQWTDATWNPIRGCSRVSEGCRHCYAEKVAARFGGPGMPYEGLTSAGKWNGDIAVVPGVFDQPLRWRRPRRIFVNSMSDLFHPGVADATIDHVFAVMALAPRHTFQVLTKRPERMRAYMNGLSRYPAGHCWEDKLRSFRVFGAGDKLESVALPLSNVWLGVSVEDQATADQRIPELLETPAAVRFISAEPLLRAVSLSNFLPAGDSDNPIRALNTHGQTGTCLEHGSQLSSGKGHAGVKPQVSGQSDQEAERPAGRKLDWVIVGGESGPGARACLVEWVRFIVDQCRDANVACFVKQLGAVPVVPAARLRHWEWSDDGARESRFEWFGPERDGLWRVHLSDRKGGDADEWPAYLRVRAFPNADQPGV